MRSAPIYPERGPAHRRDRSLINPTVGLRLPAVRGEARAYRATVRGDSSYWRRCPPRIGRSGQPRCSLVYGSASCGRSASEDVDLDDGTIMVVRSFDPKAGFVEPKSKAGRRRVPIAALLRELLDRAPRRWSVASGASCSAGPTERPFQPTTMNERARRAWRQAGLDPNRPPRVSAHLRQLLHRRWRQRQDPLDLHGAREHHDDTRSLRPPVPRVRGRAAACSTPTWRETDTASRLSQLVGSRSHVVECHQPV